MNKFWPLLKNKSIIILIFIVIGGGLLRLYKLNDIPHGFYWDEAAISYNAWGLALWNRDEFGNKLPISFKSFGDYKAPLLIYMVGAMYKIMGLHPEYIRIIIALSGIGCIALIYLLTKEYEKQEKMTSGAALITSFFIAITPWSINLSRFGVEAMLSLFLFLVGVYSLEKSKQKPKYLFFACITLALSMYAYHSAKLAIPLFLLLWSIQNGRQLVHLKKIYGVIFLLGIVLIYPIINDTFWGNGFERGKTLIFFGNNLHLLSTNIMSFMNGNFWILGQDAVGLRHGVPGFGVLPKVIFGLFLIGIALSYKYKHNRYLMLWSIVGLLPSILSTDAPHAIRALLALPPILLLATSGYFVLPRIGKRMALVGIAIETAMYLSTYYSTYAVNSATAFQYGYKDAILSAERLGKNADKFVVTTKYGQPYIYTLLYRKITPEEFKFGALANYEFHEINGNELKEKTIYVATPEEISPTNPAVVKVITIPNSAIPVFVIAKK